MPKTRSQRKAQSQRKSKTQKRGQSQRRTRTQRKYKRGGVGPQQEAPRSAWGRFTQGTGLGALARFGNRTLKAASKLNVNTLASTQAKLNALLIALQVPYVFSDGTLATDYKLGLDNVANATNEGRGYNPASKRAYNAMGFASNYGKLLNLGDNIFGTQDAQRKYTENVAAPFSEEDISRGAITPVTQPYALPVPVSTVPPAPVKKTRIFGSMI
jgi:hypothetical protein